MNDLDDAKQWAKLYRIGNFNSRIVVLLNALENAECERDDFKREWHAALRERDAAVRMSIDANDARMVALNALRELVELRDVHFAIYGYEKQHYVIGDNAEWARARALLESDNKQDVNAEERPIEKTGPHALDCTARLTTNGFCSCGAVREYPKEST